MYTWLSIKFEKDLNIKIFHCFGKYIQQKTEWKFFGEDNKYLGKLTFKNSVVMKDII